MTAGLYAAGARPLIGDSQSHGLKRRDIKRFPEQPLTKGTLHLWTKRSFSGFREHVDLTSRKGSKLLKDKGNPHGWGLLKSTSKFFLGTYHVLRSRPDAAGMEAQRMSK